VAGQIANIKGCRVVVIAGGPEKCKWLTEELKFDTSIDYKNESVKERLSKLCSGGIVVFFDNVGGKILEAPMHHLARHTRIVQHGSINDYAKPSRDEWYRGIKNLDLTL